MSKTQIRKPDKLPDEDGPWQEFQSQVTSEVCAMLEEMGFDPPVDSIAFIVIGMTHDQIGIEE